MEKTSWKDYSRISHAFPELLIVSGLAYGIDAAPIGPLWGIVCRPWVCWAMGSTGSTHPRMPVCPGK